MPLLSVKFIIMGRLVNRNDNAFDLCTARCIKYATYRAMYGLKSLCGALNINLECE